MKNIFKIKINKEETKIKYSQKIAKSEKEAIEKIIHHLKNILKNKY